MQLMSQFGKVHLYGLMRSVEYSLEYSLQNTLLGRPFIVRLSNFKQYQFISVYFMLFPMNRLGK